MAVRQLASCIGGVVILFWINWSMTILMVSVVPGIAIGAVVCTSELGSDASCPWVVASLFSPDGGVLFIAMPGLVVSCGDGRVILLALLPPALF